MKMLQFEIAPGDRVGLGNVIERLVALFDVWEGDPDLEPAGDELDASYPNDPRARGGNPEEDAESDDTGIGDYGGLAEVTGAAA